VETVADCRRLPRLACACRLLPSVSSWRAVLRHQRSRPAASCREILGMMSRTARDHTGRLLQPGRREVWATGLLGQRADGEPVGKPESGQAVRQDICHPARGHGRGDRLVDVLQPSQTSLRVGLHQPDAVRGKLARGPGKESRVIEWLWTTSIKGKVSQHSHTKSVWLQSVLNRRSVRDRQPFSVAVCHVERANVCCAPLFCPSNSLRIAAPLACFRARKLLGIARCATSARR
jgi:hypothetical protein